METADDPMLISDDESEEEGQQQAKNSLKFPENNSSNMISLSYTEQDYDNDLLELKNYAYASFQEEGEEEAIQLAIQFSLSTYDKEKQVEDKKQKGVCCPKVGIDDGRFSRQGSTRASGSISGAKVFVPVATCRICHDVLPANHTLAPICLHAFCNDCIEKYVAQKVNEYMYQVECPAIIECETRGSKKFFKCETVLEKDFIRKHAPLEVRNRWYLAMTEASVLQETIWWYCPLDGCRKPNVDDERRYPIRACTWCWKLLCYNCGSPCHMGMTCNEYYRAKLVKEAQERAMAMKRKKEAQEKATAMKVEKAVQFIMDGLNKIYKQQEQEQQEKEIEQQKKDGGRKRRLTTSAYEEGKADDGRMVVLIWRKPQYVVGLDGVTRIMYF